MLLPMRMHVKVLLHVIKNSAMWNVESINFKALNSFALIESSKRPMTQLKLLSLILFLIVCRKSPLLGYHG